MSAILGSTTDRQLVSIGDSERTSGLYILGKPRVGKSWLIANIILQDIEAGHGVFFLDPHGDAIKEVLERCPIEAFLTRCFLLDPENRTHSFGINPLYCSDIDNPRLLHATYARAKNLFDKLWKNSFEEKPWLQLILQNTLYALIETQGYTLVELPLFFRDASFRSYICNNMRHNDAVRNYWLHTFAAKSRQSQEEQMEAAQTRAEIMLGHPYVADVLGQTKTTIDFPKLFREKQILLLRLSADLSYETKKIIGTALVGELLSAIQYREDRSLFSIFVDEFQTFASFEDFSTLITQAPKLGVATTLAHHERYGQLLEDPKILGATAAIANKLLFQITPKDAQELAGEFAEKPPTEMKREEQYALTQNPVTHLLEHGHKDPEIRSFVNKYLLHLAHRREDTREEMEGARLRKMNSLDMAGIYGLQEQMENVETRDLYARMGHLQRKGGELVSAQTEGENLLSLFNRSESIRLTLRGLNGFLRAVMEGTIAKGQEAFSDFLINLVRGFPAVESVYARDLEWYIALSYGDAKTAYRVPFDIAEAAGLFSEEIKGMRPRLEAKLRWENLIKEMESCEGWEINSPSLPATYAGKEGARGEPRCVSGPHFITPEAEERRRRQNVICRRDERAIEIGMAYRSFRWSDYALFIDYALMCLHRQVERLLESYVAARFSREHEDNDNLKVSIPDIEEVVRKLRHADISWLEGSALPGDDIRESLISFLRRYKEGAFVVLSIVVLARFVYRGIKAGNGDNIWWPVCRVKVAGVEYRVIENIIKTVAEAVIAADANLPVRVPNESDREKLINVCRERLSQANEETRKVAATIDEFAVFCERLSKPENHIEVRTGQYTLKEVPLRSESDMVGEKIREMMELPKYTAYAKGLNGAKVWKGKIYTRPLPVPPIANNSGFVLEHMSLKHQRERSDVKEQMQKRQQSWRKDTEPPPVHS